MARTTPNPQRPELALIRELKERLSRRRWLIERNWWGNILYYLGLHWITYDTNARRWRQKKLSPSVPTPVTNLFRATLETVKSAIGQHQPEFVGLPARDDPRSIAAAASTDAVLQVILKEGGFRTMRRRMLDWLILTGNAFVEVSWDDSPRTGLVAVPYESCASCGAEYPPDQVPMDEAGPRCLCGARLFVEGSKAVQVPRGRIRFEVRSPFEVYLDPHISELEDQPFVLFVASYSREQVRMIWDVEVDAADYEFVTSGQMMRENTAMLATPGIQLPLGAMSAADRQHRVTVYRVFVKYHPQYPDGAYLVVTASGRVLERQVPYPWRRRGGEAYYPFVHFRFGTLDGRAWGYTPADDLLPKQYQLNKAESLFTLIMSRMANPVWLIPASANPTRITGEIGIQIEYTPVGGVKPERSAGSEAPASLVRYIQDIRQSFDELSGAFAAIRGRSVGTRTPVGTVQQLVERGFGRWATVFDGLEEGYEVLAAKALEVWRTNAKTPRVRAVQDAIGGWTFQEFLGADWDEGVDVTVAAGSTQPRTQQQRLQTYYSLAQMGLLNLQDQAQVIRILEDLGLTRLLPGVEEDAKAAYRENAEFMRWAVLVRDRAAMMSMSDPVAQDEVRELLSGMPIQVLPLVDDHALHFLTHRRLALTEEFRRLPRVVQEHFFAHMAQHKQAMFQSRLLPEPMAAPPATAAAERRG